MASLVGEAEAKVHQMAHGGPAYHHHHHAAGGGPLGTAAGPRVGGVGGTRVPGTHRRVGGAGGGLRGPIYRVRRSVRGIIHRLTRGRF